MLGGGGSTGKCVLLVRDSWGWRHSHQATSLCPAEKQVRVKAHGEFIVLHQIGPSVSKWVSGVGKKHEVRLFQLRRSHGRGNPKQQAERAA